MVRAKEKCKVQCKKMLVAVVTTMVMLFLTGCFVFEPFTRSATAKRELKEKYGESFVVHSVRDKYGGFVATCSPSRDESICFEAVLSEDGEYMRDEYVQGIISKQLQDELTPTIQEISVDCWVEPIVFYNEVSVNNIEDITIEKYIAQVEEQLILIKIFINKDGMNNLSYEEEYHLLRNQFIENFDIEPGVMIYFVNSDIVNKSKTFFEENSSSSGQIDNYLQNEKYVGFGYKNGTIDITLDEYISAREKVNIESTN